MQPHEPAHPDASQTPVLTAATRVRDATGRIATMDEWIEARMAAERRERDACLEAFVNSVARGDLIVID